MNSNVFIRPIENDDLTDCVRDCFDQFGGVGSICKGNVFIKFNGTVPDPYITTDREVILSTVKVVKETINPDNIYVMENSSVGFSTRLVFEIEDLGKRIEALGAKPLYLDEQESIDIDFNGVALDKPIPVPKILYENLVENKGENTYINIPKLKAHMMTGVTICIKNHHGLLYDAEKVYNHHLITEKIVETINVFKPDFNIVDATTVINYGPSLHDDKFKLPMGLLLSGTDPVAVDTIGGKLIGIENIKHLEMAAEIGLGTNIFDEINVIPSKDIIDQYKIQLDDNVLNMPLESPEGIVKIRGIEKCCKTGCLYLESVFAGVDKDFKFRPFVLVFGKGHDTSELDKYSGPFIVHGPCAVEELKDYFGDRKKQERLRVFYIDEHADISQIYPAILKAAKLTLADLAGEDAVFTPEKWFEILKIAYQNDIKFLSIV